MGQSKGSAYNQVSTLTPQQQQFQNQYLQGTNPLFQQAAQGYQQFLPGGGGGDAIVNDAMRRFRAETVPSILNAFGSNNKGSSALNNALASSASNLNSSLASQLAGMQLSAAGGLGGLASNQAQVGLQPSFGFEPKQAPQWQQILQALLPILGQAGSTAISGRL